MSNPSTRTITIADTAVCSDNLGDQIIMRAFWRELGPALSEVATYSIPTHSPIGYRGRRLVRSSTLVLVGGTNLVPARPQVRQLWRLPPLPRHSRRFVLVGCAFGAQPHRSAVSYLRRVLQPSALHSCRDQRTTDFLNRHGFDAVNTGCVTTWSGATPPETRPLRDAVLVLNASLDRFDADRLIVGEAKRRYGSVRLWLQAPGDRTYLDEFDLDTVEGGVDGLHRAVTAGTHVITTRLHAGLDSIHRGAHTTVFAYDDRTQLTTGAVRVATVPAPRSAADVAAAFDAEPPTISPRTAEIARWVDWLVDAIDG